MRLTRPDIMVALSILSRFMKNPQKHHWTAIKDILRYLKGTINRGLLYKSPGLTLVDEWIITLPLGRFKLCSMSRHPTHAGPVLASLVSSTRI